MAKLVSVFISATHRRVIGLIVWVLAFAMLLIAFGGYAIHATNQTMRQQAGIATNGFVRISENLRSTLDAMRTDLTATPCSPAFNEQLRKIAYLPDGLNEFLYAPGGKVHCSASVPRFETPIDLGKPDIGPVGPRELSLWVDHDLGFVGLEGMRGSIVLEEPLAAIVPRQTVALPLSDWLSAQLITKGNGSAWWHRGGTEGVYERYLDDTQAGGRPLLSDKRYNLSCAPGDVQCVVIEADLAALMQARWFGVAGAILLAALLAACVSGAVNRMIARRWSFEARFRRHLDADSIVCAYQPLMALDSGEISGCEVLARWRDVDDRIVFPDRFIDIIEEHGMTLYFTELVARRAFIELSQQLPAGRRLQVNFNIFPCDLDSARLARAFSCFIARSDRFDLVLEIIESDEIPENAQREIEALRAMGVRTYIDDFGSGYSSMENLAALSVDGVKLDRAFAMAPDDSMMARMLFHAVEMMHATGRVMVVEGVETAERLAMLRQMQTRVDFAQGYFISRPLDIEGFAAFMAAEPAPAAQEMRKPELAVA